MRPFMISSVVVTPGNGPNAEIRGNHGAGHKGTTAAQILPMLQIINIYDYFAVH